MPDSTHLWLIKLSVTEPDPGRPEKCCTLPLLSGPEADKQPPVPLPWHSAGLGKTPSGWLTDSRGVSQKPPPLPTWAPFSSKLREMRHMKTLLQFSSPPLCRSRDLAAGAGISVKLTITFSTVPTCVLESLVTSFVGRGYLGLAD